MTDNPTNTTILGYVIPPALLASLSRVEIRVVLVLIERTVGGQQPAAISIKEFGRVAGISAASLSRAVTALERRDVVRVTRVTVIRTDAAGHRTNIYTLNRDALTSTDTPLNLPTMTALIGSKEKRPRRAVNMRQLHAIVAGRSGYPEARLVAGERVSPRDIAMRLNALDSENTTMTTTPERVADNRIVAKFLEAEMTAETNRRTAEQAAAGQQRADHKGTKR